MPTGKWLAGSNSEPFDHVSNTSVETIPTTLSCPLYPCIAWRTMGLQSAQPTSAVLPDSYVFLLVTSVRRLLILVRYGETAEKIRLRICPIYTPEVRAAAVRMWADEGPAWETEDGERRGTNAAVTAQGSATQAIEFTHSHTWLWLWTCTACNGCQ